MKILILTLMALVGLFPLIAVSVGAQQKELRLSVFRVDAAVATAKARGLFAAEGLNVKITMTPSSTEQMRGVSKGSFEIVSTAFDNVLAWSGREGAEIIAVAQPYKIVLPLFVRPEIRERNDLRSKKLAVDAVDTAYALVLRRILLAHGLDLNRGDYELVPLGATEYRLNSMIRGETFAAILNPPYDTKAKEAGLVRFGDHLGVLPDYPGSVLAVNRGWAQSHREDLVGFLRAWHTAMRWVNNPANREEAVKLVAAELKLNSKAAAERLAELSQDGSLNVAGLESVLNLRTQFDFKLPMGTAITAYYDLDYYRAAAGK